MLKETLDYLKPLGVLLEQPYLLTYKTTDGMFTYSWFFTEEEMDEFIDSNNIKVVEAYYITAAQELSK